MLYAYACVFILSNNFIYVDYRYKFKQALLNVYLISLNSPSHCGVFLHTELQHLQYIVIIFLV